MNRWASLEDYELLGLYTILSQEPQWASRYDPLRSHASMNTSRNREIQARATPATFKFDIYVGSEFS